MPHVQFIQCFIFTVFFKCQSCLHCLIVHVMGLIMPQRAIHFQCIITCGWVAVCTHVSQHACFGSLSIVDMTDITPTPHTHAPPNRTDQLASRLQSAGPMCCKSTGLQASQSTRPKLLHSIGNSGSRRSPHQNPPGVDASGPHIKRVRNRCFRAPLLAHLTRPC